MICKRCEVQQGRQSHRMVDGFCRHCYQALKQPDGMAQFIYEENNG